MITMGLRVDSPAERHHGECFLDRGVAVSLSMHGAEYVGEDDQRGTEEPVTTGRTISLRGG